MAGAYGSGKTEVAINLAVNRKRAGYDVKVADLDLVNPYFRTREASALFNRMGIELVIPAQKWLQADLPTGGVRFDTSGLPINHSGRRRR